VVKPPLEVVVVLGDPHLADTYKPGHRFNPEDLECVAILKRSLAALEGYRFTYFDDHPNLIPFLLERKPQLAMNLCDTGYRNDAALELHVPALLELLDIPCTGSGPHGLALTFDKSVVRAVASAHGIPTPFELELGSDGAEALDQIRYPALIKPARADGSLGITRDAVVHDRAGAARCLERLRAALPGHDLLAQEFLPGPEYGIGLVGNPGGNAGQGFTALPPLEVDYSRLDPSLPRLLGYESKALPDSPYWTDIRYRRAETLDEATEARLIEHCKRLFARLQCRDYARFDFRTDAAGTIKLLEVNANPAWAHDGKLNLMAGFAGLSHGDLLGLILQAATHRTGLATSKR